VGAVRKFHQLFAFFLLGSLLFTPLLTGLPTLVAAPLGWQSTNNSASNAVIAADTRVNLRSGPGTTFSVVAKLDPGATLKILSLSASKEWTRVSVLATGVTGWVASQFVQQGAAVAQTTTTTTQTITQTQTTADSPPGGPVAVVQAGRINVRGGPGTHYPIVSSAAAGTSLSLLALNPDGTWYQVQVTGQTNPGWILATLARTSGGLDSVKRLAADQLPAAPAAAPVAAAAAPASAQ
jgi:uncharacterized protein YgiM (DUF1202 family)